MAWCTYCLFSYCSELDLLHLLRREHPSNLDRLAGVARQTVLGEYLKSFGQDDSWCKRGVG